MDSPPSPPSAWQRVGSAVLARPRRVIGLVLVVAALAGAMAGLFLRVRPGYVDLLDSGSPLQRRYLDLLSRFGNVESLHVLIEARDGGDLDAFVTAFSREVRAARDDQGEPRAARVFDRVDQEWFSQRLPALLPLPALDALAAQAELPALVADPSAARLLDEVRAAIDRAAASGDGSADPASLAALASLLDGVAAAARGEQVTPGDLLGRRSDRVDAHGLVRLPDGRVLVTIAPADTANDYQAIAPFLASVREAASVAQRETGADVTLAFTGAPALIVDEMQAVTRDITIAAILSIVLVTLLFFVSFQSLRHVLLAGVANVAGLALTFGAAWVLVGYLNLFSSVFAAVLAGLGIDFGIHVINHYEAHRRDGMGAREALLEVYRSAVPAIVLSALITAAAFLAICTSEFDGFAQLGLISGVGVILCVAMSVTLVPALLAWESGRAPRAAPEHGPWSERLLLAIPRHAVAIAAIGGAVTVAAIVALPRARFDHDLMNLQPAGTEAVALQQGERRVNTYRAFSIARDLDEAAERTRRFAALPSVAEVSSAASFLPAPSARRQELLGMLAARVAVVPESPAGPAGPVDVPSARMACDALGARVQELQDLSFEGGNAAAVDGLEPLLASARALRSALDAPTAEAGLTALRDRLGAELRAMASALPALARAPVTASDLPPALAAQLVGNDGSLAILVEPRESVWDRPALERFVAEVRTIDPEITGPPVQVLEMTELMRVSLLRAAAIAFAAIVVLVAITMRSVLGSVLALLPLLLGFALMLGAMACLDVPLNPANLVALPLLLGIGVDGGVHVAHRWLAVRDATRTLRDVGHALLITSLTTVAGFVPLLLARHQGIRSLGVITCLGSVAMLVSAVVLVPALLALLDRVAPGRRPA